ncbi:MAG: hypothetical protein FMNOHCHN_01869 [Ignavibacteriaceae bacterium]|nr:hypothetical protein [Ignavibacteriaceae bacterium]
MVTKNYHTSYVQILLLILLQAAINLSAQTTCTYCKKSIEGNYITVEGKNFHPEHFLCSSCSQVITGSYAQEKGKFYHPDCLTEKNAPFCDLCKKVLKSSYVSYDGKKYHEECYRNSIEKKCAVCKEGLTGYITADIYGNEFHSSHEKEYPKCDACTRLTAPEITGGGVRYSDGRAVCKLCHPNAVFADAMFNSLYKKVLAGLSSSGFSINTENVSVKGVDKNTLKSKAAKSFTESLRGFCDTQIKSEYRNDKLVKETASFTVYVLNGLPPIYTESIIAHELMHVWFHQNGLSGLDALTTEGSCNYLSWTWLSRSPDPAAPMVIKMLEADTDPVYGEGFRRIKQNFAGKPLKELFVYLRGRK